MLLGDRARYFKVAFELSFVGAGKRKMSRREKLHSKICSRVYSTNSRAKGPMNISAVRRNRYRLSMLRKQLERKFEYKIHELGYKNFRIDTIFLDVPEPGKDQISTLYTDSRTKRSNSSEEFVGKLHKLFSKAAVQVTPEFVELRQISPIAKSLDHALERWARKIRIFMGPYDMVQLARLNLSLGDIALLWECVLSEHFRVGN